MLPGQHPTGGLCASIPCGFSPQTHHPAPPRLPPAVDDAQVPFYATTLARARLQKAQERLAECLRDPALRADAWPAPRVLLLLKLFATVFPASGEGAGGARAWPGSLELGLPAPQQGGSEMGELCCRSLV